MNISSISQSLLLAALARAEQLARISDTAEEVDLPSRGFGTPQSDKPLDTVATVAHLESVRVHIQEVQNWLRDNPQLITILDEGISNQFKRSERRAARTNILINAFFAVIGAIIGLLLPNIIR